MLHQPCEVKGHCEGGEHLRLTRADVTRSDAVPVRSIEHRRVPKLVGFITVSVIAALATSLVAGTKAAPAPSLRQLVGQRLVVSFAGSSPSPSLLARIRKGEIGGVLILGANVESAAQARELTRQLHRAARDAGQPRLLVMVDQEGGDVRRFRWAPPGRSAEELGLGTVSELRAVGRATAAVAPLARRRRRSRPGRRRPPCARLDDRGPGSCVLHVADCRGAFATAFAKGLADGGILATAKHFPGLGGAVGNTDLVRVSISTDERTARADLVPFVRLDRRRQSRSSCSRTRSTRPMDHSRRCCRPASTRSCARSSALRARRSPMRSTRLRTSVGCRWRMSRLRRPLQATTSCCSPVVRPRAPLPYDAVLRRRQSRDSEASGSRAELRAHPRAEERYSARVTLLRPRGRSGSSPRASARLRANTWPGTTERSGESSGSDGAGTVSA